MSDTCGVCGTPFTIIDGRRFTHIHTTNETYLASERDSLRQRLAECEAGAARMRAALQIAREETDISTSTLSLEAELAMIDNALSSPSGAKALEAIRMAAEALEKVRNGDDALEDVGAALAALKEAGLI